MFKLGPESVPAFIEGSQGELIFFFFTFGNNRGMVVRNERAKDSNFPSMDFGIYLIKFSLQSRFNKFYSSLKI